MNYLLNKQLHLPPQERTVVKEVMRKTGVRWEVAWARLNLYYKGKRTLAQVFMPVGTKQEKSYETNKARLNTGSSSKHKYRLFRGATVTNYYISNV